MAAAHRLQATRRHPLIGAEVHGVDLAQLLDDATIGEVHALRMEHLLLIFPDRVEHVAMHRSLRWRG